MSRQAINRLCPGQSVRSTWLHRGAVALLLVLAAWGFSYQLGAAPLLDDPNEGEYAETAREMVETGDWLSPQLNYVLFLNKPPLTYWLIALSDRLFGVNAFAARVPSALAGIAIVVLVLRLGTVLFDIDTGLLAAFILVTTAGFFLETHQVRPDRPLTAAIAGSLLSLAQLLRAPANDRLRQRWPLIGWQAALAFGVLSKGLIAVVIPACVLLVLLVTERQLQLVFRLLHPRAWWLFAVLVAPWHIVMHLRHPGFLWDYIFEQHVLFFFDRKFPRDSVPVSLGTFWAALALRLFPWTIFVPLSAMTAATAGKRRLGCGERLALTWVASVLLLFSAAPSRMEHYTIPALPACALLLARFFREHARAPRRPMSMALTLHTAAMVAIALAGCLIVPGLIAADPWLAPVQAMPALAARVTAVFLGGFLLAALAALLRRQEWVAPLLVATFVPVIPLLVRGLQLVAHVDSSAALAGLVRARATPEMRVVLETPVEYQNCAGLNFYTGRKLDLLEPPGFAPPAYLTPHMKALFISRDQLAELWRTQPALLVTDPLAFRPRLDGTVPHPYTVVGRDHTRWLITNGRKAAASDRPSDSGR